MSLGSVSTIAIVNSQEMTSSLGLQVHNTWQVVIQMQCCYGVVNTASRYGNESIII